MIHVRHETGVVPLRAKLSPKKLDVIFRMIDSLARASAMIACGDMDEDILKATDLPLDEIWKLRKKHQI